ncbi:MAG: LLM class F420-dependent oxidoreductase [Armatimonadota bacterium]|nr:LLM class F420-dependent oxidoreductase [Armatimonadota bacterium]MDR7403303.1 LLM class F420-dependent oxidoreductase [Armatimonadota bacterium]
MRVGVVFPQTEIGTDPGAIREFAQAVERMGYTHLLVYDHVVGARPDRLAALGFRPPYTYQSPFHEPFVLYGYLAAVTRTLELATGILILPQRQTVLVAKQAAEVDVLSGGRLRLGVGLGWNPVEYEALGQRFSDRGRRMEEQVALLRRLWTEELVDFSGRYHTVRGAGLNPLPVQRPIPIWMGGGAEPALRRIARLADGWIPEVRPEQDAEAAVARMRQYLAAAGRDPSRFGIEGRIRLARTPREEWPQAVQMWQRLGATHLSVDTMRAGLAGPEDHLAVLESFRFLRP